MDNRIIIDGRRIGSREELFGHLRRQIQEICGENRLIGSNLDALHDVLTSLSQHTVIEIRGQQQLAETLGDYWQRVIWMLNDCLDENRDLSLEICE